MSNIGHLCKLKIPKVLVECFNYYLISHVIALWNFSLGVPPRIAPTEAEVNRKQPSDYNRSFTFGKQKQGSILATLFMCLNSRS